MLNLTKIALAAAIVLGSATLGSVGSQASSADDYGAREGGFKIGPLGQWMGSPASNRYLRGPYYGRDPYYGFAFAPAYHRSWRYQRDHRW